MDAAWQNRQKKEHPYRCNAVPGRGMPLSTISVPVWRKRRKEYEQQTGIKVNLEIMDPKGNQNTQNSQVDRFLSLEYDAICVNMVDRSAASYVINKAMDAGTPVVFSNREPVEEDMKRWERPLLCRGGRAGIGGSAGRTSGGCVSGKSRQS